ncbi:MAG: iron-sulfur cluster repair di-iron protein [Spirosomataceae bacterium]
MELISELKVGQIVRKNPKAADVFNEYGIDYCCGGNVMLSEVCEKQEINFEEISQKIEKTFEEKQPSSLDFDQFELDFLADYVTNVHHNYLYKNLPEIRFYVEKVFNKHGERFDYLPELHDLYLALEGDLLGHLPKEENILFPYIKKMINELKLKEKSEKPFFGTIQNPISVMHAEHDEAGEILHRLRKITNNYTAPENACNSHLVMISKLKEMDADLVQHIHIENNILFPKVVLLEEEYFKNAIA